MSSLRYSNCSAPLPVISLLRVISCSLPCKWHLWQPCSKMEARSFSMYKAWSLLFYLQENVTHTQFLSSQCHRYISEAPCTEGMCTVGHIKPLETEHVFLGCSCGKSLSSCNLVSSFDLLQYVFPSLSFNFISSYLSLFFSVTSPSSSSW